MMEALRVPGTRWVLLISYSRATVVADLVRSITPPIVLFMIIFLVGQLAIFAVTMRGVVKPLVSVGGSLEALSGADADLTVSLPVATRDEIGQVAVAFNAFMGKLRDIMAEMRSVIERTNEVKHTVSSSTEETSAAIEQISANLADRKSVV